MASPVFFVKKKDGALRFVQDYWCDKDRGAAMRICFIK
jgi:hypothetical protein